MSNWIKQYNQQRKRTIPGKVVLMGMLVPYRLRRALRMVCARKDITLTDYITGILTREVISEIGDDWKNW